MQRDNTLYRVSNSVGRSAVAIDEQQVLGLLKVLEKNHLESLNDDESKLTELINDQQQVKKLEQDKEMLIASNKSLAEYNLKFQPKLHQGREMLALRYEQASKFKEEYDTLKMLLESGGNRPSLDTAHALLQTKAAQSEEATEAMGEDFLAGKIDCDAFLDDYVAKRTETHLLKIKAEKLGEMVQHAVHSSVWDNENRQSSVPYPTTHSAMPLPPSMYMPR